MMLRFTYLVCFLIVSISLPARSAQVTYDQNTVMGCFVTLKGEIRKGDAAHIKKALALAADKYSSSGPDANTPDSHNNSLIVKRLCLESPGGTFTEAIEIAKFIHGDWSTAVSAGKACESACSIIFMAGSISPEDDRGIIARRFLHPYGRLGFHAPSLKIEEGEYSASAVSKAYNIALRGLGQIYAIAGDIKFPPSLIGAMIGTPPEDMLYIETVGQAARWHIAVAPSVGIKKLNALAVINACNNDYLFKSEVITLNGFYENAHKIYYGFTDVKLSDDEYEFKGLLEGFGQEAAGICQVSIEKSSRRRVPRPTDKVGWVSNGEDDVGSEIYHSQFFGPSTPITSLARQKDLNIQNIDVKSRSKDIRKGHGRCIVLEANGIVDNEPCKKLREYRFAAPVYGLTHFIWPSGGKTVQEGYGPELFDKNKINGVDSELQIVETYTREHKYYKTLSNLASANNIEKWSAECWDNSATGKTFCFQEY